MSGVQRYELPVLASADVLDLDRSGPVRFGFCQRPIIITSDADVVTYQTLSL